MIENKVDIPTKDGSTIKGILFEPLQTPKGCIQINPGTGIPQSFYKKFARHCAESGFATLTFDYRGIGESKPSKLRGFDVYFHEWSTLDMSAAFKFLINKFPDLYKTIVGHSMGGQMIGFMDDIEKADKIIMIASGTGYWKDMPPGKFKNFMPFLWYFYIPFSTAVHGYANARKLKQGENLPKNAALQWRKWCLHEDYWEVDFGKYIDPNNFSNVKAPIHSLMFADDNIISERANQKLLSYFNNTTIDHKAIDPKKVGLPKLGHFGFFSGKSNFLWKHVLDETATDN